MKLKTLFKYGIILFLGIYISFLGLNIIQLRKAIQYNDPLALDSVVFYDHGCVHRIWIDGSTPLMFALDIESKDCFVKLLELGANPNQLSIRGSNAIYNAARMRDSFWILHLMQFGGNANLVCSSLKESHQTTPLQEAAEAGRNENLMMLIDQFQADVNSITNNKDALIRATMSGKFDCVYSLLERGADFKRSTSRYLSFATFMHSWSPENEKSDAIRRPLMQVIQWLKDHGVEHDKPTLKDGVYVYE